MAFDNTRIVFSRRYHCSERLLVSCCPCGPDPRSYRIFRGFALVAEGKNLLPLPLSN